MKAPATAQGLQDALARTLRWHEGQMLTDGLLQNLESQVRHEVKQFVMNHEQFARWRFPDIDDVIQRIRVTHDGQGRVQVDIPREVLLCLETQSMISF